MLSGLGDRFRSIPELSSLECAPRRGNGRKKSTRCASVPFALELSNLDTITSVREWLVGRLREKSGRGEFGVVAPVVARDDNDFAPFCKHMYI